MIKKLDAEQLRTHPWCAVDRQEVIMKINEIIKNLNNLPHQVYEHVKVLNEKIQVLEEKTHENDSSIKLHGHELIKLVEKQEGNSVGQEDLKTVFRRILLYYSEENNGTTFYIDKYADKLLRAVEPRTTDKERPKYKFIKCFSHSEFNDSFEMWDLCDNSVTLKFSHGVELILNSNGTFQLTNMAGDTV